MKRIKSACLEQTVHFELKADIEHEAAVLAVRQEAEKYKQSMDRRHVKYKVLEEKTLPDGSIQMKIKKQYNCYPCGEYLD